MKNIKSYLFILLGVISYSCTNLDEEPLDFMTADEYYTDKSTVEAAVFRPMEHAHWCAWDGDRWMLQELTADHFVWTQKGKHGWDEGQWVRLHRHNWDILQNQINGGWVGPYQGIGQVNTVIADLNRLDLAKLGVTDEEKKIYLAELRALRAWYYTWLIDFFRHVPISEDIATIKAQSTPQEVFAYIEKELKEVIPDLKTQSTSGRFNKAFAAAVLVRIYLNSKVWTGVDRYTECADLAQKIINKEYGNYSIDNDYRGPFRAGVNGYKSPENIFEWPHKRNYLQLGWLYPCFHHYKSSKILDTDDNWNGYNGIHLAPSRDLNGQIYDYALGKPLQKYHDADYRKMNFRVTDAEGNYDGFFLYGAQYEYDSKNGFGYDLSKPITGSEEYSFGQLFFTDQVGRFSDLTKADNENDAAYDLRKKKLLDEAIARGYFIPDPKSTTLEKGSQVVTGEENSGVRLLKFPWLPASKGLLMSNSIAEVRLAEVYYALAECKYRKGDKEGAAKLLDEVRKRNYLASEWNNYKYEGNANAKLTDQEFIDELGREFLGEHRRRSDLIRWGRFGDAWWDKDADKTDKDYTIFPIPSRALNSNPLLKQTTKGW